jgi:hypothetical protein
VADSKPRPSGGVARSKAESYVRVRIHQEEGKKTLRRVIEDPKNTVRSKKE